jgi:ribosome-binding ATPase YchF (GTP1/OBG family)
MAEAKGNNPEITPTEEIEVTTEEIVAEAMEEVKEAPSRIHKKLGQLAAVWERASVRSSASGSEVVGSSLAGMYDAKWQALAKEREQGRPDKR